MKKVKLTSHKEMEADKIKDDMAMTPHQRIALAFHLADMAREIYQDKMLPSKMMMDFSGMN